MRLQIKNDLPFVSVSIVYRGMNQVIHDVLVDTGSASSIFSADEVASIKIIPEPEDILYTIRGVGGSEVVFSRQVDYVDVGGKQLSNVRIEVGGMDYGFRINGILGMDFLTKFGAILDLDKLELTFKSQ